MPCDCSHMERSVPIWEKVKNLEVKYDRLFNHHKEIVEERDSYKSKYEKLAVEIQDLKANQ